MLETEQEKKKNALFKRVHIKIFTVKNKKFYILFVSLYPQLSTDSAHALHYIFICSLSASTTTFLHHLPNAKICG